MTDPSSSWRRRRRRGGKHQEPVRRASSAPLPPDAARRNRDAAFGMPRRSWIASPSSSAASADPPGPQEADTRGSQDATPTDDAQDPARRSRFPGSSASQDPPEPSQPRPAATPERPPRSRHGRRAARAPADGGAGAPGSGRGPAGSGTDAPAAANVIPGSNAVPGADDTAHDLWSSNERSSEPGAGAARTDGPEEGDNGASAEEDNGASAESAAAGVAKRPLPRRPEPPRSGSLPRVAFWTVLTSILPGSGLLTTRLRRLGWVMLAILVLTAAGTIGWLLLGDPLRSGVALLTSRNVLIAIMVTLGLVGVVWGLQILVANLAHSTKQRLRGPKRAIALAIAALMVVAVALPFGRGIQSLWAAQGLLGSDTVFGGGSLAPGEDPWADVERLNILLLGQDAGEDRTGTRPDTIMVASIDTETGRTALFSIPRNLENVHFPEGTAAADEFPDGFNYFGGQQDLINAVWTWAEDVPELFPGDPEPGLTATSWAVEETLGLELDYYAMVNLQGFEDLVDALGGVEMVVERRIPIGGGTNENTGAQNPIDGYIEPGMQKLDGFHALWYARSREGSDDFDRICRQQRMVRAVTEEADPGSIAMSVPGLVTATENNIETDIPSSNLDAFVDLALRVKDAGFISYPITQEVTSSSDADWDYLKEWVQASIDDSMEREESASVIGETEDGSDDPAPTGDAPEGEEGADGGLDPSQETEEAEDAEEGSPEDADQEEDADSGGSSDPEIDEDPLQSCLPGAEQE